MILSLVASGRITAREAERLITVWNADREVLWIALAGAAAMAAQGILHPLGRALGAWCIRREPDGAQRFLLSFEN